MIWCLTRRGDFPSDRTGSQEAFEPVFPAPGTGAAGLDIGTLESTNQIAGYSVTALFISVISGKFPPHSTVTVAPFKPVPAGTASVTAAVFGMRSSGALSAGT